MTYRAKLVIPVEEATQIDHWLSNVGGKKESTVCKASYEVPFPNGYKAKVYLMADLFSWTEGCLCNEKGEVINKTQSQHFLFDTWVFILDGACYMVDITREDDLETDLDNIARTICAALRRMDIEVQDIGDGDSQKTIFFTSGLFTDHEFSMGVPKEEWDDDPYTSVSRRLAKMLQNDSLKFSEEGFRSLVF